MLTRGSSLPRSVVTTAGTFARALRLLFIAALLAVALGTGPPAARSVQAAPGGPARSLRAAPGTTVSPEGLLNTDGTLDLSTGFQGALDLRGWQVTLDGERGPLLEPASVPDASQVDAWQALPKQGLNERVLALAVSGSDLYVGGAFTRTGDGTLTNLGRIARYDTTANTWHPLPNQGLNGDVHALAVDGSDLYVGGDFIGTGDGTLNLGRIARYDTMANSWHALPNQGLHSLVYALAVVGSDLYVGGFLTQTGDGTLTNLGHIARYDTTANTWHPLPKQGLGITVKALAVVGSHLYVGGQFSTTGDGTLTLNRIARYDTATNTWHPLPRQGLNESVQALAVSDGDLYVGGWFRYTGDGTPLYLGRIARYDTTGNTWHALPNQGLNSGVFALAVSETDLYVGGEFSETGDGTLVNLNHIARYDTTDTTWNALPRQGLSDSVLALAVSDGDLYVGGYLTQTGDGAVSNLGGIARLSLAGRVFLPMVVRQ